MLQCIVDRQTITQHTGHSYVTEAAPPGLPCMQPKSVCRNNAAFQSAGDLGEMIDEHIVGDDCPRVPGVDVGHRYLPPQLITDYSSC